jgi:DNA-binding transcriptional MerR regulator/class 3 adenylate cyclase
MMISSIELIRRTGISRATLNNYIKWGLLPKPDVRKPDRSDIKSRRIGYFPSSVLGRIEKIHQMKLEGISMPDIISVLADLSLKLPATGDDSTASSKATRADALASFQEPSGIVQDNLFEDYGQMETKPHILLEDLNVPTYLVNHRFEFTWANSQAEDWIFHQGLDFRDYRNQRNIFRIFLGMKWFPEKGKTHPLARAHLALLKTGKPREYLETLYEGITRREVQRLMAIFDSIDLLWGTNNSREAYVKLMHRSGNIGFFQWLAFSMKECFLCVLLPLDQPMEKLAVCLSGREGLIKKLVTGEDQLAIPVVVLVANLTDSQKIRAELPPEIYLSCIERIGEAVLSTLDGYTGIYSRHHGDGYTYVFMGDSDSFYLIEAVHCALEIRDKVQLLNREWQSSQGMSNPLCMNIGLDEGHAYLTNAWSVSGMEWQSIGDVASRSEILSRLSGDGRVWATKNLLVRIAARERKSLRYGIRRLHQGGEIFLEGRFACIKDLLLADQQSNLLYQDMMNVVVTEIFSRTSREGPLEKIRKKT